MTEAEQLAAWSESQASLMSAPVSEALDLLRREMDQDIEPGPDGGGSRIRDGVTQDRVISIGDPEMRHGRKRKSKVIKGYKRHVVVANRMILGTPWSQRTAESTSRPKLSSKQRAGTDRSAAPISTAAIYPARRFPRFALKASSCTRGHGCRQPAGAPSHAASGFGSSGSRL